MLLVDGDGFGGGLDLLVGAEDLPGLRWQELMLEGGRVNAEALHGALPVVGEHVAVLACGRGPYRELGPAAIEAVVEAGRGAGDLVVCDVPRWPGAVGRAFLEAADLVVVMVVAELRCCAAAGVVVDYIRTRNPNQGMVIRGPAPGGLRTADVAAALDIPVLAAMRPEPQLADRLERGGLRIGRRGHLRAAAEAVLDVVAARPDRSWVA